MTSKTWAGSAPNIDAEEIKRRQAEKQKKIDENRRRANAAKGRNASGGGFHVDFGGRAKVSTNHRRGLARAKKNSRMTLASVARKKVTVSSKAKTVASKSEPNVRKRRERRPRVCSREI